MKIFCEICGAYTIDEKEIEKVKKNNICPVCLHMGSLYIDRTDHPTEKVGDMDES